MVRGGPKLSGLQRQVLSLYRSALRASHAKEQAGGESFAGYARMEIDRHRSLDRKDILRIEHLIRKGRRQLDLLTTSEVTGIRLQGSPASSSSTGSSSMGTGGGSMGTGSSSSSSSGAVQGAPAAASGAPS